MTGSRPSLPAVVVPSAATAACRRGLSRAAGHLPGGDGGFRPAFSFACGAAPLLLPGPGRAVPPARPSTRRGSDDQPGHEVRHVQQVLRPSALRHHVGRASVVRFHDSALGVHAPDFDQPRPVAPVDDRGAAEARLGQDQGAQAGAAPRPRLTLSSGWEPGTRARRGLRAFFLLDCPGGAAAAGAFSQPFSGGVPRVTRRSVDAYSTHLPSAAGHHGGYRGLPHQAPNRAASALRKTGSVKRGLSRPRAGRTPQGFFALFANSTTGGL